MGGTQPVPKTPFLTNKKNTISNLASMVYFWSTLGHFEQLWSLRGWFWEPPGSILEPPGSILEPPGLILEPPGPDFGPISPKSGQLWFTPTIQKNAQKSPCFSLISA